MLTVLSSGPAHSRQRQLQAQNSNAGFGMGSFFCLPGSASPDSFAGRRRLSCRCFAIADRTDPFFALPANAAMALEVTDEDEKIWVYASISA